MTDLFGYLRLLINLILYPFALTFLIFYRCLQWLGLQPTVRDYKDNVVLITGSANGLGREIALAFARAGASLALLDIDDVGKLSLFTEVETKDTPLLYLHRQS